MTCTHTRETSPAPSARSAATAWTKSSRLLASPDRLGRCRSRVGAARRAYVSGDHKPGSAAVLGGARTGSRRVRHRRSPTRVTMLPVDLPHPITGQPFESPVPPGTGWPGRPGDAATRRWRATPRGAGSPPRGPAAADLDAAVSVCRACDRLVAWREDVAVAKRASYARRALLGPADRRLGVGRPGGARRSGSRRPRTAATAPGGSSPATGPGTGCSPRCTGSGSPSQPTSVHAGDGQQLVDTRMVAAVRCAPPDNRPTTTERDTCAPWLEREVALVAASLRAVVCLGRLRLGRRAAHLPAARVRRAAAQAAVRARRRGRRRRPGRTRHGRRCSAATTPRSRTPSPAG